MERIPKRRFPERRFPVRTIPDLDRKVLQLYETTRVRYEDRYYTVYLQKCYDNIKSIIRVQNYNRLIVILTVRLDIPLELIRIIQGYAKIYAPLHKEDTLPWL
jgi:hypothetical protein